MVRLKTRYLVVEVVPAASARKLAVQKEDVAGLIKDSIARNYGDYGVGLLQYAFQGALVPANEWTKGRDRNSEELLSDALVYFSKHTQLAVVRCAREQCKLVESSLAFVTECQNQEVRIRVARVCGSSRTCRDHLLKFSLERSETLNLLGVYPNHPKELEDEIAAIDPQ